jgi:hypothetical protein
LISEARQGRGHLTNITAAELLEELQALAAAVLETFKLSPPPAKESMRPSLIRFELWDDGAVVFCAARDAESDLKTAEEVAVAAESMTFNECHSWIPVEPRDDWESTIQRPREAELQKWTKEHLVGDAEMPGLLWRCDDAARKQCDSAGYLGPLRVYPARNMTVAEFPHEMDAEGLFSWRLLSERADIRAGLSDWLARAQPTSSYKVTVNKARSRGSTESKREPQLGR